MRNITYRISRRPLLCHRFRVRHAPGTGVVSLKPVEAHDADPRRPPPEVPRLLHWSGQTHRRHVRKNNEDTFLALTFDGREVRYLGKTGHASLAKTRFRLSPSATAWAAPSPASSPAASPSTGSPACSPRPSARLRPDWQRVQTAF
jgi:hypothetical protein